MAVRALQLGIVFTVGFYLASAARWLDESKVNVGAFCRICKSELRAQKHDLRKHADTLQHEQNLRKHGFTPLSNTLTKLAHVVAGEGLQEIPLSLHLEDPKDVIVARGQPASFNCRIQADTGKVDVRWHHNDVPIPSNDSRWQLLNNGTLYIPRVAGKRVNSLEGEYQCLVRNEYGSLLSNPAKLRIATLGRDFVAQPENVSVPESQPVVLPCNIHSFPSAKVTWERNLLPLPHTTRYVPLPSGALLITSTHSSDVGSYRCKIVNQILKKTKHSQAGQLSVSVAPTVVIPPKFLPLDLGPNVTALVGENLTLYCAVSGWPLPTVQWLKNMSVIANSSTLELQNVTADTSGDYVCSGYNSGGRISQTFSVEAQQIPYFNVTPVSSSYPSPRTLRLQCEAAGIPKPRVHWLINGTTFELDGRRNIPQSGHGLVISHSFTTDTGLYQCIAENTVGRKWVAAQLVPNYSRTRPSPPADVQCRPYNDTSICLRWSPPPKINITAYSVYAYHAVMGPEFLLTNVTTLLAANLNSSTNYTFYVRLYTNEASDQSQTVTCRTGTNGKRNLHVQIHGETSAELNWSEISSDVSCEGTRSPYRVQWRSANQSYINVEQTTELNYIITGLLPERYEFRVISSAHKNENGKWAPFTLSTPQQNDTHPPHVIEIHNETEPTAPYHLEAKALSPYSINLTWSSNNTYNHFFSICFVEVKPDRVCESGGHYKSPLKQIKITNLNPNTSYEFKVRAFSNDGNYGTYSHALEIRTLPEGPASIRDIKFRVVNSTTICLKWRAPSHYKNAKYVRYIVSYKPNQNSESWQYLNITASQKYKACWLDSQDTLSTLLHHLDPSLTYTVVIKAEDESFVSPAAPIVLSTQQSHEPPEHNSEEDAILHKQKLGFILGTMLSLLFILSCITCLIFRRRCLKQSAASRPRLTTTTSYYSGGARSSPCTSLQLRHQETCTAEAQEMQNLIGENGMPHIPAVTPTYLDTKGGANFPNSQVNGSVKFQNGFLPNGHVHITENPRFYIVECNGHRDLNYAVEDVVPVLQPILDESYEEDPNSNNVQNSKLRMLLLRDTEAPPSSTITITKSLSSSTESALNVTQLTCIDDSLPAFPVTYRKVSAPLGPNG